MMAAILNSAMLDSAILHKPLTQTHSFSLILMMAAILNSAILDSTILDSQNKLHSFNLTQLDDGSHLEFCYVGFRHCHLEFRHLAIFSQIHLKTLSLLSDSGSLTVWQSGSHHLQFGHLGFNHLSYSSYTHSHLPRLVPTICTKKKITHIPLPTIWTKNITHSFWLNLMMAAILNSVILNSAILDSVILHKTLIETNSIWLKLPHCQSTWWWQPSWILPYWIGPFCTE